MKTYFIRCKLHEHIFCNLSSADLPEENDGAHFPRNGFNITKYMCQKPKLNKTTFSMD